MSDLYDVFLAIFRSVFRMFSFGKNTLDNSLKIFVKSNTGNTLTVGVDPQWDIKNVKNIIAPQLGANPEEVKIILAGKELEDSFIIAVRISPYFADKFLVATIISRYSIVCRTAI